VPVYIRSIPFTERRFHRWWWLRDVLGRKTRSQRLFFSRDFLSNNPSPSGIKLMEVKNRTCHARGSGTLAARENAAVLQRNKNRKVEERPW
jgi:hypothetical protein